MINSVTNLIPLNGTGAVQPLKPTESKSAEGASFSEFLNQAINQVNSAQQQADKMTELMIAGKAPDIHSVMIAGEKATVSFQLGLQIRNKAVEAYQEIMRTQM